MTMLKLALKGAWARKTRLLMLVLIIMASVGFIVGTYVFTDTIKSGFNDVFGTVYKDTSAVVRGAKIASDTDDFDFGGRGLVPESVIEQLRAVPGVAGVEGEVQIFLSALNKQGKVIETGPPTFGYVWRDTPGTNPFRITTGTKPGAATEVVVNRFLAKIGQFKVGDTIDVIAGDKPEKFNITGIATFGTADGSTPALLFTPTTALRLSGYPPGQYNEVWVVGNPGVSQQVVRDATAKVVTDPKLEVVTGRTITEESQKVFQKFIDQLAKVLLGFGYLSLFVGVFVIANTFGILITQRQREVALMRAVGASGRQVRTTVIVEAVLLGLVGSALGLGFGMLTALGLKTLFSLFGASTPGSSLSVLPRTLIVGMATGVVATLLSSYFPARKASRTPPIAALRDSAVESNSRWGLRTVLGSISFVASLVSLVLGLTSKNYGVQFVGASFGLVIAAIAIIGPVFVRPLVRALASPLPRLRGTTGVMARENAIRNPRRTASSALALTIGVAVVAFFLVVGQSIKGSVGNLVNNQFKADYIVRVGSNGGGVGLQGALANQLASTSGIAESTPLRFGTVAIDGKAKPVIAADPLTVTKLFDFGKINGSLADLNGDAIAIKTETAVKKGWKVGTVLKGQTETGPVDLTLVATFEKGDAVNTSYLMSISTLTKRVPSITQDVAVVMKLAGGANANTVRAALDSQIVSYPNLKVQDRAEFKKSQGDQVNGLLIFVYILLALAIFIALIGIAINLRLSILERIRELGVLRAVGQQRRQTRSMVRWESVLISLLGTVTGLVVGTAFGAAIIKSVNDAAFNTVAIPPRGLVAIAVLGALAGVVAAWWPARKAAKTDLMAALATS